MTPFDKYRNPDPRCRYPFRPEPLGYCWSYAHHVVGTTGFENMEAICATCPEFDALAKKEAHHE